MRFTTKTIEVIGMSISEANMLIKAIQKLPGVPYVEVPIGPSQSIAFELNDDYAQDQKVERV